MKPSSLGKYKRQLSKPLQKLVWDLKRVITDVDKIVLLHMNKQRKNDETNPWPAPPPYKPVHTYLCDVISGYSLRGVQEMIRVLLVIVVGCAIFYFVCWLMNRKYL